MVRPVSILQLISSISSSNIKIKEYYITILYTHTVCNGTDTWMNAEFYRYILHIFYHMPFQSGKNNRVWLQRRNLLYIHHQYLTYLLCKLKRGLHFRYCLNHNPCPSFIKFRHAKNTFSSFYVKEQNKLLRNYRNDNGDTLGLHLKQA